MSDRLRLGYIAHPGIVRYVLLSCLLLVVGLQVCAKPKPKEEPQIDWKPGLYMTQAMATVIVAAKNACEDTEFGYDDTGHCVLGAYLHPDKSVAINRELKKGSTYLFVGGGDEDAGDIDLSLTDADGNEVAKDEQEDNAPVIRYKPKTTGSFTVKMTLVGGEVGSFCGMAILRTGGYDVPIDNLKDALANCIVGCIAAKDKLDGEVSFHDENNQWALLGTVLEEEQTATLTHMFLEKGTHFFVATGDKHAEDLNLYLLDGEGEDLESDTADDATPFFLYKSKKDDSDYGLKFENTKSDGASLVIGAILDVR